MKLKALAAQLGLSITTVSRALNGYEDVSAATRERVLAVAAGAGYAPNASAQRLITGRSQAIGFVLPVAPEGFADPFLLEMLTGLGETLRAHALDLVLSAAEPGREELNTYNRLVRGRRVDGLVVARTRVDDERIAFLRASGIAFVTHGRWRGALDFDTLECDNAAGGRLAASLMTSLGHRDLLLINAPSQLNFAGEREAGVREAANAAGARLEVVEAPNTTEDDGEQVLARILERGTAAPTAIICATDRLAIGALRAARGAGRAIGTDLSIVGYDDLPFSRFTEPPLTTVRQPIREAGRRLVEIVLARVADANRSIVAEAWQPELVLRATHGPAPKPSHKIKKTGRTIVKSKLLLALLATASFVTASFSGAARADVVFLSNQLRPIEEAQKVREVILKGGPAKVDYVVDETGPWIARIKAEAQAGKTSVGLLGGLHGDFATVAPMLDPVDDLMATLGDRGFSPAFIDLAKLGTGHAVYVPWMQATYIMVANKKALPYLPAGATVETLTYAQLAEWGANIQKATGERKLGFPAGPKGLMYRLLQGSLYPAYTGGVVRTFKNADAVAMWTVFTQIWANTNPRSTSYDFMQESLLADEVWIGFDHVARMIDALRKKPDDFVAFPAPSGPKGLGYMPVVAGLALPKKDPDRAVAAQIIAYLTTPAVQITTLRETAFFPVVKVDLPADLSPGLRLAADAIAKQAAAPNAIVSLLPVGLGEKNGEFNKVYSDAFQRIILRNQAIQAALDTEGAKLAELMKAAHAPCWQPDAASPDAVCPVQ